MKNRTIGGGSGKECFRDWDFDAIETSGGKVSIESGEVSIVLCESRTGNGGHGSLRFSPSLGPAV